jgi:hypothetical protein
MELDLVEAVAVVEADSADLGLDFDRPGFALNLDFDHPDFDQSFGPADLDFRFGSGLDPDFDPDFDCLAADPAAVVGAASRDYA